MKKAISPKASLPKARSTVFKLHSPKAKKVSVAGDFNNWDTKSVTAKKDTNGTWVVSVDLKPGRYEYKFFVDGSWIIDPASGSVYNIYGSQNSVVEVR